MQQQESLYQEQTFALNQINNKKKHIHAMIKVRLALIGTIIIALTFELTHHQTRQCLTPAHGVIIIGIVATNLNKTSNYLLIEGFIAPDKLYMLPV